MTSTIPLTARHTESFTLAAATPVTIDVPVNGARNWMLLVKNDGANPVTDGTVARGPLEGVFEDAVAIPGANLPTAGASMPVDGENDPLVTLRLVLTSAGGTTVTIKLGGN